MAERNSQPPLTILEVVRVEPAHDSSNSSDSLTLPLTFFDLVWIKVGPVERVFFYRVAGESTRQHFDSVIFPKLKVSLSLTLRHFLPLAGHLAWDPQEPKPQLVYSQSGAVSLTVAESIADFSKLSGNEARAAVELHDLVPELPSSDESSSPVALQVTLFPNQGFSVGIVANHAVMDGKTSIMFVKSWAHICKQEIKESHSLPQELTPNFDRTIIKDPANFDMRILNAWLAMSGEDPNANRNLRILTPEKISPELVRVTLELTRDDIQKLKDRVKTQLGINPSTFVTIFSYVATCMVRARGGDGDRRVGCAFAVDYRSRLNPPAPATYFGNCVGAAFEFDGKARPFLEEGKQGFINAVKITGDLIAGLGNGGSALEKLHEIVEGFVLLGSSIQMISVAGSTRFGVYETDFGWGKPEKVEILSIDTNGAMSMAESRNGGVEIGMCLEKDEMQVFVGLFLQGLRDD